MTEIHNCAGRLAAAFGGPQSAFAVIAGPPELWKEYLSSSDHLTGAKQTSSRGKAQAATALLEPVQAKLRCPAALRCPWKG